MPMKMDGCDIFDNCAQCPVPFCPGWDVAKEDAEEKTDGEDDKEGGE